MNYLIYKLQCAASNKCYVGMTKNLPARLRDHRKQASGCKALRAAIAKHGWESFSVEVLEQGLSKLEAQDRERFMITECCSRAPDGYNLTEGGECPSYVMSEEHKQKISVARRGQVHTEEAKAKMRAAVRTPLTEEQKAKRKATMASPEYQAKIAYRQTPAYKEQCRLRRIGKPHTEERKQRIREGSTRRLATKSDPTSLSAASASDHQSVDS